METKKARAFIVEDEFIIAQNLSFKLSENGYEVDNIVNTGEKAIELLEVNHKNIDFILMDIMLDGEMDGIQTAEIVKQRFDIPVIFLTAYSSETFLERSKIAEPYAYILKPFSDRELFINIEIALYKHQAELKIKKANIEIADLNANLQQKVEEQTREIILQNKQLEKLSSVVEQAKESVIITNTEGIIEYVNPAFTKNLGYKSEEVIGKNPRFLKSGVHHNDFYKVLWDTINSGKVFENEMVNKTKSNEMLFEEKTIAPLIKKEGEITHFVSFGKNINNQKLIEELHKENEKLIELVFEAIPAVIFIFDINELKFGFINKQVENILGYTTETILKMETETIQNTFLNGKNFDELINQIYDAKKSKTDIITNDLEIKVQKENKKFLWMNLIATVFETDDENNPTKILGIASDISESRQKEKQLKVMLRLHEIMKNKEQKLRTLSLLQGQEKERKRFSMEIHDNIGQLLTATKLNVERLNSFIDENFNYKDEISSLKNIKELIKQTIVEVRKISNDITPSTLYEFGLISSVKQMLNNIKAGGLNIDLITNVENLRFDSIIEQEFYRIIQEGINNAIKHSEATSIVVQIEYVEPYLKVKILDNGLGFKKYEEEENMLIGKGKGLISMQERCHALNAKFLITSSIGNGCEISFEINTLPINKKEIKK